MACCCREVVERHTVLLVVTPPKVEGRREYVLFILYKFGCCMKRIDFIVGVFVSS